MSCETLLENLDTEHCVALILLERTLVALRILATSSLHLHALLLQRFLLLLETFLDDGSAVEKSVGREVGDTV